MRYRFFPLIAGAAVLGLAAPAAAAVYTVGADGACNHPTLLGGLLAAAFNPGADELRLARNLVYADQAHHLTNWDPATVGALTIAGGYDDCADTQPSGETEIDGTPQQPVFEIDSANDGISAVTLRRLKISGSGQRGIVVEGESDLDLEDSMVTANAGGGILVQAGAILRMDYMSSVYENDTTAAGAGIACSAAGLELAGVIQGNDTIGQPGGGFRATGCIASLVDGLRIYANSAWRGGGIYADGGSFVQALSGPYSVTVDVNEASDTGGGIYAAGATVTLVGAAVEFNTAQTSGGGLYAAAGGLISMDRASGTCGGRQRCSELSRNRVPSSNLDDDGAAAATEGDGEIRLFQTWIEDNVAGPSVSASAIRVAGEGAVLRIEGASFMLNSVARLVEVGDGGSADLAFVSASLNGYPGGNPASPIYVQTGGTARINSSVFHPSYHFGSDLPGAIAELDCILVSDLVHLGGAATRSAAGDPLFTNPALGNLRPRNGSPAIDFCDATAYVAAHGDLDGETRGYDLAGNANGTPGVAGGLFDLGFDEVRPLFVNGFASGDTTAWSATVP